MLYYTVHICCISQQVNHILDSLLETSQMDWSGCFRSFMSVDCIFMANGVTIFPFHHRGLSDRKLLNTWLCRLTHFHSNGAELKGVLGGVLKTVRECQGKSRQRSGTILVDCQGLWYTCEIKHKPGRLTHLCTSQSIRSVNQRLKMSSEYICRSKQYVRVNDYVCVCVCVCVYNINKPYISKHCLCVSPGVSFT